jgi:tRNA uridine 5-carboxymethylaminomethyl modification enzyme
MFTYPKRYDVIVVGAGHAGIEASLAAARMGCQVLLLTSNADTIGQMSCNPAIGGLAKGHLAREIDALGGEMAKTTDMSGLQFRMLNTKNGPAVWSPRAQCDKKSYQFRMKWICERQKNLDVKQVQCKSIIHKDGVALGVETLLGVRFLGSSVVITTGTFLMGLMHIGCETQSGGRSGESACDGISASLRSIGLELGRFKTGTPPRLLRRSIDFSKVEVQNGDEPVPFFTYWIDDLFHVEQRSGYDRRLKTSNDGYPIGSILDQNKGQLPCFITRTTPLTAELVRNNLHMSPLYCGQIEGIGPRYCPSIEDKIVRFNHKLSHQIFLEPEGITTDEVYVNGLSTSLPLEIQVQLVRSVIGCENAEILRPAYAVEYDCVYPTQLHASLETKACRNLYLAGQINGTSGYEEAAAQGLMAGINSARRVQDKQPVILRRDQAYIGVLIDDLVTKGTSEPYRMFTSRAEYRLLLRQDNADQRLSEIGHSIGLLEKHNYERLKCKQLQICDEIVRLNKTRFGSETLAQLLRRTDMRYDQLPDCRQDLSEEIKLQVETELKYAGYIKRQEAEVEKVKALENQQIPPSFDYSSVPSLRLEARQKLMKLRPTTLGQAGRISGVSPADTSILMVWIKRQANITTKRSTEIQMHGQDEHINEE